MITPRFKLSQTDESVLFCIRIPYCSLKDIEVSVEDEIFVFTCTPYHLRLHLPGRLTDEFTDTKFDTDSGELRFSFKKANPGEHFEDLELITKLLCPKVEVVEGEVKISVLTSSGAEIIGDSDESSKKYGFAMLGNFGLTGLSSEFSDVLEVDPIEVGLAERKKLRLQLEQGKFDVEHYLADILEPEPVAEILKLESPWFKLPPLHFTDEELDFLKDLKNIEYSLNDLQITYCHNSLIDILFAYCYDRRTTHFEGTIESGWTIVKLAASLSWLDGFTSPKEALTCAYRRAVIYPLYRNFQLCDQVLYDLLKIISLGERCIIKCLIDIHKIFLTGDCCRYILNDLFIDHYIRYVMKWDKESWQKVVDTVQETYIKKEDLGLNLKEIEEDCLTRMMSSMQIGHDDSDDSTDSSSDSDSLCSCSDSDSSDSTETD